MFSFRDSSGGRTRTFCWRGADGSARLVVLGHVQAVERLLVYELEQLEWLATLMDHGDRRVALLTLPTAGGAHAAPLLELTVGDLDLLLRLEVEKLQLRLLVG